MKHEDFFDILPGVGPFDTGDQALRADRLQALVAGPIEGDDWLETAITLTQLVHDQLVRFGTNETHTMTDSQMALAQRALTSVLGRQGIPLALPWRDLTGFRSHWIREGCAGSGGWQARRDLLETYFEPVHSRLSELEEFKFRAVLADPVTSHAGTGWPHVDEELTEMKRLFRTASTPQDYRDVGNRATAVLEALSRTVYHPERHLRSGEAEPSVDKTKMRIGRFIEDSLAGADNEHVRAVATKVVELAHSVKHSTRPNRREAGIAADSVILLANILRRVDEPF